MAFARRGGRARPACRSGGELLFCLPQRPFRRIPRVFFLRKLNLNIFDGTFRGTIGATLRFDPIAELSYPFLRIWTDGRQLIAQFVRSKFGYCSRVTFTCELILRIWEGSLGK